MMKKTISLLLVILLVLALFVGCGGEAQSGSPTANPVGSATKAPDSGGSAPAPDPDSPYCLAAGKFAKNDAGWPAEKFAYSQPLTTSDEIITKWTTCYTPQHIPEGGFGSIPTWVEQRERTGVHIEYVVVDSANRSQNFSVLLASDALDDIIDQGATFYKAGSLKSAVEDGFFANMADYVDYLPNYLYEVYTRAQFQSDMIPKLYYDNETIPTLYGMVAHPCPAMGYFLRQDWLDEMGMGAAGAVKTYDQLHNVLTAMKTQYSSPDKEIYPLFIQSTIEIYQGALFSGFDTSVSNTGLTYPRVKDGTVEFCGTTEDCRSAMTLLNAWFAEGLISPNYTSFTPGSSDDFGQYSNALGCHILPPSGWAGMEEQAPDPGTRWEPIPRTKMTEDQVLRFGYAKARDNYSYGSTCISAKCENIPLAASWVDWAFSDEGSDYLSFGLQGYLWDYNDKGERRITDWCKTHEAGSNWLFNLYATNGLVDCSLFNNLRELYYDGGDRIMGAFQVFTVEGYKGEYDWPSAVTFTDEERDSNAAVLTDLNTYFQETFSAFVDGSKPMSEWDSYVDGLFSFGYADLQANYQLAYNRYLERLK